MTADAVAVTASMVRQTGKTLTATARVDHEVGRENAERRGDRVDRKVRRQEADRNHGRRYSHAREAGREDAHGHHGRCDGQHGPLRSASG
jgi:hypothetical protein